MGKASTNLVKQLVAIMMHLFPKGVSGKRPTMLMVTHSRGSPMLKLCRNALLWARRALCLMLVLAGGDKEASVKLHTGPKEASPQVCDGFGHYQVSSCLGLMYHPEGPVLKGLGV